MQFRRHVFFQFTVILGADVVIFDAENMSFGMLVASTLAPTLEDHRAIPEDCGAQEGRPWGPGLDSSRFFGFLSIFDGFRDRIFRAFNN